MFRNYVSSSVVLLVAAALICTAWVAPCPAELIQNGSLENGIAIPSSGIKSVTKGPGSPTSDINYWTTLDTQGSATWDYYMSSAWTENGHVPEDGLRDVMVSSGNNGSVTNTRSIAQSFLVSSGNTYDASYYTWKRPNSTATWFDAYLSVDTGTVTGTLGAGSPGTLTGSGTNTLKLEAAPGAAWTHLSFSFVPSAGATATLKFTTPFTAGQWSSSDVYLDNVSVIPEPSTLALLAAGLVGLLCYAWRKRR